MEHSYSLRDIQKQTGLKYDFLRRLVKDIPEMTDAYAVKGMNNAFFFSTNGLACFREISKMKEQQYTLPTIREQVLNALPKEAQPLQNNSTEQQLNMGTKDNLLLKLLESSQENERENYKLALEAKEALIAQQKSTIQALETGLRLLTDGRPPEEVQKEAQEKAQELRALRETEKNYILRANRQKDLVQQLEKCSWYQPKRRKKLLKELDELLK